MNKTSFSIVAIFTLFAVFALTSCEDEDGYGLDDFVVSLATVNPIDEQAGTYYLTMDNGRTLWPAASNVVYKPAHNQRVLVNFTLLGDTINGYGRPVKINYIQNILTKKVEDLTAENEAEIGDDPIRILSLWTGDNYLNINFGYNTGGEQTHRISLVRNKLEPAVTEEGTIVLEFRHNAYGDPQRYGVKGYAAYDLRPLQVEGRESAELIIRVRDFNNETKEYKVEYKYNIIDEELTENKTFENMPEDITFF